ncbi:MAG: helix-turn-helix domain-containing protein [Firmicutes bacterium]|nr:helix-turn-helix domain-containing protein [Bacillota bacterium]
MDQKKIGALIAEARRKAGYTQQQLAERLSVTAQAVSKWERGCGCPDLPLAGEVSRLLGLRLEDLLSGELPKNQQDGGNMKRSRFYVCPDCGNILASSGPAAISCCGKTLEALTPAEAEGEHLPSVEYMDGGLYVHMEHPMEKEHFISFIAYVTGGSLFLQRMYPEQGIDLRFPRNGHGWFYIYCNQHGLFRLRY